jgi:hypothetical protein
LEFNKRLFEIRISPEESIDVKVEFLWLVSVFRKCPMPKAENLDPEGIGQFCPEWRLWGHFLRKIHVFSLKREIFLDADADNTV